MSCLSCSATGGRTGLALAGLLFRQIIIFILTVVIFIKNIFGIHLLIMFKEKVVGVFDIRNYLQQLTDAERALLNKVVIKKILVIAAKTVCYE